MESRDPDPNAVLPTIVYDGPQRDVPGLFDLLHAAHPRARIAPPYRELHLTLRARVPMDVYDEITVALDDGFFIGMVVHLEASLHGMHVVVREAAYLLARVHVDTQTFMPVLAH